MLVGAFMLGIVALAIVAGLGIALWVAVRLRIWWIKRHLRDEGSEAATGNSTTEVIEAEYTVISRRRD